MKTIKVQIASYKKAQVFKKDYVRKDGEFLKFNKCSGNHSYVSIELKPGEEFDARGSVYREGVTKWTAANTQSWAKFKYDGEKFTAHKFDGSEIPIPNWCKAYGGNELIEGYECKVITA